MLKFSSQFKENRTFVKAQGIEGWVKIKEINDTRVWVKLHGWCGSWQRGHIIQYTNKKIGKGRYLK